MAIDARQALGSLGERLASEHLSQLGYSILDRNFRTRYGELDVVASGGGCLVFCEVKTRVGAGEPGPYGPLASIGVRKRRQVRLMAGQWLASRSAAAPTGSSELRFDAMGITLDRRGRLLHLEHLQAAF